MQSAENRRESVTDSELVMLTSCSDSDFESSIVSFKENKPDGVNPNSKDIDCCVRKNEGKILWFSADCMDDSAKGGDNLTLKLFTVIHCSLDSAFL